MERVSSSEVLGMIRKSRAPASMACRARSMSREDEYTMTGVSGRALRREFTVWRERATGSAIAQSTRSGLRSRARVTASVPKPDSPQTLNWDCRTSRFTSKRGCTS